MPFIQQPITSGNEKSIKLIPGAPAGWYAPKGYIQNSNDYWGTNNVTLQPVSFDKNFTLTNWGVVAKDWSAAGATFAANGGKLECALYNSNSTTFAPTTLNTNLGALDVSGTDPSPGGSSIYFLDKTITTPITLTADTVYWVAVRAAIKDGAGGYTNGQGINVQQCISTGFGVGSSQPQGDSVWGNNSGARGAIYDDANSSLSVGSWASTHAGLYPFVSLGAADLIYVSQGIAVHLKGAIA